jgi:hypothetical protein
MIPGLDGRPEGLAGPLEVGGRVRVRFAMKTLPVGFLALTEGILSLPGRNGIEVP